MIDLPVLLLVLGRTGKVFLRDNPVIDYSEHRFTRGKSCLTNLISFHYEVTHLIGQGKPVNVEFWNFTKLLILL